jgi:hypothetical protein
MGYGRDGLAAGIGRYTDGRLISDAEGNLVDTRTGEAVAPPDATAQDAGKPPAKDVPTAAADADPLAALDADDVEGWRRQLADGIRTAEELQKAYNLSDAELEAVQHPPKSASVASIERQLAELKALKTSDAKRYWSNEVQVKELRPIEQLEAAESGRPEAAEAEAPATAAIEQPEASPRSRRSWRQLPSVGRRTGGPMIATKRCRRESAS